MSSAELGSNEGPAVTVQRSVGSDLLVFRPFWLTCVPRSVYTASEGVELRGTLLSSPGTVSEAKLGDETEWSDCSIVVRTSRGGGSGAVPGDSSLTTVSVKNAPLPLVGVLQQRTGETDVSKY